MTVRRSGAPGFVARFGTNIAQSFATLVRPPSKRVSILPALLPLAFGAVAIVLGAFASMLWVDAWAIGIAKTLPLWVVHAFARVSDFGKSGWFLVPAGIFCVLALLGSSAMSDRATRLVLAALTVRAAFVFLAIGFPGLVIQVFKRVIGRVRPSALGPFAYEPWSWQAAYNSLPSGHATTAFSAAMAIGALWPRTRAVMWTYAAVIGLSRIVVAAHYPSDVLAGGAIGVLGAVIVRNWFAARRLDFAVGADGRTRALPGPSLQRIKRVARRIAGH